MNTHTASLAPSVTVAVVEWHTDAAESPYAFVGADESTALLKAFQCVARHAATNVDRHHEAYDYCNDAPPPALSEDFNTLRTWYYGADDDDQDEGWHGATTDGWITVTTETVHGAAPFPRPTPELDGGPVHHGADLCTYGGDCPRLAWYVLTRTDGATRSTETGGTYLACEEHREALRDHLSAWVGGWGAVTFTMRRLTRAATECAVCREASIADHKGGTDPTRLAYEARARGDYDTAHHAHASGPGPRMAATVVLDPDAPGDWCVGYAEENVAGYTPTTYRGDRDYCQKVADSINTARGLTAEDVLTIVSSSFAAQNRRATGTEVQA